ncbi:hypothetical protein M413DRAFT_445250 [Hebeloma cylindrosporum]|uniref:Uncharacterized protein n=1 Tax=Hebeloma cylindrosporum TaxID=76867 RepID=A0A0C2YJK4_HEBCY|nr:hypothetical protein M413DRAFT_445250 [Hebeloma cylindrosporum h7]
MADGGIVASLAVHLAGALTRWAAQMDRRRKVEHLRINAAAGVTTPSRSSLCDVSFETTCSTFSLKWAVQPPTILKEVMWKIT